MDNAGNVQATPSQPSTSIFVSTNLPPVILPISDVVVPPGDSVTICVKATDPNGDQLTYSLAGAPAGASIEATNGLFYWQTDRNVADTTRPVTVMVTDNGVPPLSTSATFNLTVLDYGTPKPRLHQFGRWVKVLPFQFTSRRAGVTNLLFTVQVPEDRLTNWTVTATSPQIASCVTLQDFMTNILISLRTTPGQSLQGTQQISKLNFQAVTNRSSGVIHLPVTGIAGIKPDASPYSYYTSQGGSVLVVEDQPLLQASVSSNQVRTLGLYGIFGTNYELQFTTNLASPFFWEKWLDYTQTNGVIKVELDSTNPVIFFRLMQLIAESAAFLFDSAAETPRSFDPLLRAAGGRARTNSDHARFGMKSIRRVGTAEGTPKKIPLRSGQCRSRCKRFAAEKVASLTISLRNDYAS